MPGMMDTILNLGMNRDTLRGEMEQTGAERFAFDAYHRFIQLFGKIALGIADEHFDEPYEAIKKREDAENKSCPCITRLAFCRTIRLKCSMHTVLAN